jgi:hypothetical protein
MHGVCAPKAEQREVVRERVLGASEMTAQHKKGEFATGSRLDPLLTGFQLWHHLQ